MERYTIFGRPGCGFCVQAKNLLERKALPFRYVDIYEEGITAESLEKTIGKPVKTVPQIFYGTEYIGGYQELDAHLKATS
ncbi:MAG: GrxA family glutaredoxin [Endozoicomonas sp. (ex Botrylloides leachii)]|nr:GrxA family glutaredoxin [Endozoicomonas sp. (ex Botrylloides leachii)]